MATGDDENILNSDPAYAKYLEIANSLQRDWANETLSAGGERWSSLEEKASGSISSEAGQEYEIYDGELAVSPLNYPKTRITLPGKSPISLKLVSFEKLANTDTNEPVYAVSADKKRLYLNYNFAKTVQGGEIEYVTYRPAEEMGPQDETIVDDPNWLIYMLAAEIARTDVVQSGQYGNLIALATNSMDQMKGRERGIRVRQMDVRGKAL